VMDHIAHKHGLVVVRAGVDHDVTWCMARRPFEPKPILERVIIIHQDGLPGAHDGKDAVLERKTMRCVFAAPVYPLPVSKFATRHDVTRVRKGRNPATVFEPGIPTNMVPMQVGAHHIIYILDLDPGFGQICDVRGAEAVKLRASWPLLVVAEAGIDQDRVVPGLHDKGVKAEEQMPRRLVD